jgi:hypothetical protein
MILYKLFASTRWYDIPLWLCLHLSVCCF